MASNPYVNKVQYAGNTLIDLTTDSVRAASLEEGYTAHDKSGAAITGTALISKPIPVASYAAMQAYMTSDNIGKVFEYTGTTGTFVNGDLYILESV